MRTRRCRAFFTHPLDRQVRSQYDANTTAEEHSAPGLRSSEGMGTTVERMYAKIQEQRWFADNHISKQRLLLATGSPSRKSPTGVEA